MLCDRGKPRQFTAAAWSRHLPLGRGDAMMYRLMNDGSPSLPAEISANVPDWSREAFTVGEWSPSRRLLAAIRAYQRWRDVSGALGVIGRGRAVLEHRFWSIACACDIP